MKNIKGFLYILIFTIILIPAKVAKADDIVNLPITITIDNSETSKFINYLNEQRIAEGRDPYIADSVLMNIAKQRVADMCVMFGHRSPLGTGNMRVDDYLIQALGRNENPNNNEYSGEDVAVGIGNAEGVFKVWRNSTTHAPVLMATTYKYCGVAYATYCNTGYWVLVATTYPLGSQESLKQGIQNWSTVVPTISRYFQTADGCEYVYYKETADSDLRVKNRGDSSHIANGYRLHDAPGLFTVRSNNPDIFSISADFKIRGLKVGSGSLTVFLNGVEIGSVPVVVQPQCGHNGDKNLDFHASFGKSEFEWEGTPICPKPSSVTDWYGNSMTEGVDYRLEYSDNSNPSAEYTYAMAKVIGINNYESSHSLLYYFNFTIHKKPDPVKQTPVSTPATSSSSTSASKPVAAQNTGTISGTTPSAPKLTSGTFTVTVSGSSHKYTGKEIKPTVYVKAGSTSIAASYYTVTYSNNVNAGTAKVTVKGRGNYAKWSGSTTFKITKPADEKTFKVELKKTSVSYNGKSQKPAVKSVKVKGKSVAKKYYSVSYKNNKNVGTATVTITGKGQYKGYKGTVTFKINPKLSKAKLNKAKSSKKGEISIGWKKVSQADGYQVQICLKKNFKSAVKTIETKGISKTGGKASKLKSKTTYYIRVRAKRVANGKTWYGAWSSVKKVKTK